MFLVLRTACGMDGEVASLYLFFIVVFLVSFLCWKWGWFLLRSQLVLRSFPFPFGITVVFESLNFVVLYICFSSL